MIIITLAAGLGSRLEPSLDEPIPKALVSVGSETVLERQVRQLSIPDNTKHIAVVGQQGACWTNSAFEKIDDIVDEIVINEANAETEAGYSFLLGLNAISSDEDVLVIDGDIIVDDHVLEAIQTHEAGNVALVRATETKTGVNNGACVDFEDDTQISQCGFNVRSNYVYSGVMRLSTSSVRWLSEKDLEGYKKEQLATLIDEIAKKNTLAGHTVTPEIVTTPLVDSPLDRYDNTGKTKIERRKGKIKKYAVTGPKKLRNEVEWLQNAHARHPNHFPYIFDISYFDDNPSYEMPDYSERGYTPLDELIRSGTPPEKLSELTRDAIKFVLTDLGENTEPLSGLYKNAFLPKIRGRYKKIETESKIINSVIGAESIYVNGRHVPGLPKVIATLETGVEFLGRMEPANMKSIHGDFKPDNILINEETGEFILIDPRGRSEIGTITQDSLYDVAKFLTSTQGYYTAFKHGDFNLSVETDPSVAVDYEVHGHLDSYKELTKTVLNQAEGIMEQDQEWRIRVKALTGLLLVSNAPVHINTDNQYQMAIAELVRGLELFGEALEEFMTRSVQRGNIVNINTGSDLDLAQRLFSQNNKN